MSLYSKKHKPFTHKNFVDAFNEKFKFKLGNDICLEKMYLNNIRAIIKYTFI